MHRPRRLPRKIALALAIVAGLVWALAAGQAASAAPASLARPAAPAGPASPWSAALPSSPGGLCSVPGIGDIGGLLGFCSLGSSGLTGDLNNICQPSLPEPEPADAGIDSLVRPPAAPGRMLATPYNEYGVAGQYWAATDLQCSDLTSLIGNDVAGMVFDVAKSIDRVTISSYQAAAGNGILSWLGSAADKLITGLGRAIYFPYLALMVILAAIWLAWQGLIRKRGTATVEGTVWMVVACAVAILLIGRPAGFTAVGQDVSNGISQGLNAAFAKLPSPGQASCLPVGRGDPQIRPASYSYTSGGTIVGQNANELWTVLVCKPWLDGEFGTTGYSAPGGKPTPVNAYGRQLLWAQAIAMGEKPTSSLIKAKQATYAGIAGSIRQHDPGVYPLFQGKQWTSRLEVGFAALLAAALAGVLVLLISVTLILLKLSFLLLLIVGPFFLLIGTHPGFGRVVAVRWAELLVGVLLKQAAVALVLSVLLYCYALIMGTSDAVLPWALKILMIALVTIAAFIYRRPFQHLFAAVGYGVIGSRQRAEADLSRAGATARHNTLTAATAAVPGLAAYRTARWARRNPAEAAGLALGGVAAARAGPAVASGPGAAGPGAAGPGADGSRGQTAAGRPAGAAPAGIAAPAGPAGAAGAADQAADGTAAGDDGTAAGTDGTAAGAGASRAGLTVRARGRAGAAGVAGPAGPVGREPPPLNLPPRQTRPPAPPAGPPAPPAGTPGWTRGTAAVAGGPVTRATANRAAAGRAAANGAAANGAAANGAAASGAAARWSAPGSAAAPAPAPYPARPGSGPPRAVPPRPVPPRAVPPRPVPSRAIPFRAHPDGGVPSRPVPAGPAVPPRRLAGSPGPAGSGPWAARVPAAPAGQAWHTGPGRVGPARPAGPPSPQAAPPWQSRHPGTRSSLPAAGDGPAALHDGGAGPRLPGDQATAPAEPPAPFWLRPTRRRKWR